MLTTGAFTLTCVPHGTIETVSDMHEITNVPGMKGIGYMISD